MIIYEIFDFRSGVAAETDQFIMVTDPASVRQIVTALKNEGMVPRGCRFASFALGDAPYPNSLAVYKNGKLSFVLGATDSE